MPIWELALAATSPAWGPYLTRRLNRICWWIVDTALWTWSNSYTIHYELVRCSKCGWLMAKHTSAYVNGRLTCWNCRPAWSRELSRYVDRIYVDDRRRAP